MRRKKQSYLLDMYMENSARSCAKATLHSSHRRSVRELPFFYVLMRKPVSSSEDPVAIGLRIVDFPRNRSFHARLPGSKLPCEVFI